MYLAKCTLTICHSPQGVLGRVDIAGHGLSFAERACQRVARQWHVRVAWFMISEGFCLLSMKWNRRILAAMASQTRW